MSMTRLGVWLLGVLVWQAALAVDAAWISLEPTGNPDWNEYRLFIEFEEDATIVDLDIGLRAVGTTFVAFPADEAGEFVMCAPFGGACEVRTSTTADLSGTLFDGSAMGPTARFFANDPARIHAGGTSFDGIDVVSGQIESLATVRTLSPLGSGVAITIDAAGIPYWAHEPDPNGGLNFPLIPLSPARGSVLGGELGAPVSTPEPAALVLLLLGAAALATRRAR